MFASIQPPHPPPCLQSRMCASIHPVSLRSLSGPALDFAGVACTGSYLGECTCSAGFGSLDCSQLLGTPVTLYAMGATEFFDPVTVRLCRPPRDVQSTPAIRSHRGDAHPPASQGSHIIRTHTALITQAQCLPLVTQAQYLPLATQAQCLSLVTQAQYLPFATCAPCLPWVAPTTPFCR